MRLRKLEFKDAKHMLEWMLDETIVKELKTDFSSKTIYDCQEFIVKSLEDNRNLHLAIINDEDEYMGTVSLKNINLDSAEFGIIVRKRAMGKGYSLFAMNEIFKIGFIELKLKEIYWCVSPLNERACRFYDKNGYKKCKVPNCLLSYTDEEKELFRWYKVLRKDFYDEDN